MSGAAGVSRIKNQIQKNPHNELENMVLTMSKMLVDCPNEIVVRSAKGDGFIAFEVVCAERDAGTLIGSRGKHAEAMRLLLMAAGAVRRTRVTIQFMSRDQDGLQTR
jgi:predicted RNA-binding protein YlqC (UPF0109 family)